MTRNTQALFAPRTKKALLIAAILLAALALLGSGLLALFVVPAPDANTAVEVSGRLISISPPHPQYGDLTINFVDGRSYYVNRADEIAYFAWQRLLQEVNPGDLVTLTVVRPLAWRLPGAGDAPAWGPVAGVRTASTVYMDPAIAATWTAQAAFARSTAVFTLILAALTIIFTRMRRL